MSYDRDYTIDGVRVPGVTTVTGILNKPGLNRWREEQGTKQADDEAQRTADRGNRIHRNALLLSQGQVVLPIGDEEVDECTANISEWLSRHLAKTLLAETAVGSRRYKFAGRPDLVALIRWPNDAMGITIIDWKGSRAREAYFEWDLQTAGYSLTDEVIELAAGRKIHRATITINPEGDRLPWVWRFGELPRRQNDFIWLRGVYADREIWMSPTPTRG